MGEEIEVEVIERLIDRCNECKFATCENCEINWVEVQAICSLLERYKVQRRQLNDAFNRGWIHKDRIKKELEELENMKVDGEVFTTSVNFAKKILQSLLEEYNNV